MTTSTVKSVSVLRKPETSLIPYYCTEDEWRNYSGLTDQGDFPSATVAIHLRQATEQVKKDAFYMIRYELAVKNSDGEYFTGRRWWGNKYGTANDLQTQIIHGQNTKYDLEVFEAETTSAVATSLWLYPSRIQRQMTRIPYSAITEIDPLNCWFKLSSDYPTENRQVFVNYWAVGKPLGDIEYELRMACMEMTTILALKRWKTIRMKKGSVQMSLGKKSITRNEQEFDEMIKQHYDEYYKWIRWVKPFVGRRVRVGRAETHQQYRFLRRI